MDPRILLGSVGIAVAGACSPAPAAEETSLFFAIQGDPMGGLLTSVHVQTKVDGVVITDQVDDVTSASASQYQKGFKVVPAAGKATGNVEVLIEATSTALIKSGGPATGRGEIVLRRTARGSFVSGKAELLRVRLEVRCLSSLVGGSGPDCTDPTVAPAQSTCESGRCVSDSFGPSDLEDYADDWLTNVPDICRPKGAGAPVVIVGGGQTDYVPLAPNQELSLERGPQGGHHLWIGLRLKNLKQSGSTVKLSAMQPDTGLQVPPLTFVFQFEKDEGSYCKLYGLRYQLDLNGTDYHPFLGKPLDVTATVTDSLGGVGTGTAHILVSTTVLGE